MSSYQSRIADLVEQDSRYAYEAYEFIFEALSHTQRNLGRTPGAGSVRSTHSESRRCASFSLSKRAFLASMAASSDCLAAFNSLPTLARSSGVNATS